MSKYELSLDAVPPKISITYDTLQRIRSYVSGCPVEINGFGVVVPNGHNSLLINDAFIINQTATPGSVDIAEEDMHAFLYEISQSGIDRTSIRLQWHSHVSFDAYFSGTDLNTIYNYEGTTDWMISLVTNRRGEYSCRIDQFGPNRRAFDVELNVVIGPPSDEMVAMCMEEIVDKVNIQRMPIRRAIKRVGRAISGNGTQVGNSMKIEDSTIEIEPVDDNQDGGGGQWIS